MSPPRPHRVLFVFIDGVGIGAGDPTRNPLAAAHLPTIRRLSGGAGPFLEDLGTGPATGRAAVLAAVDANLGMEGLPQSGTGQTALLTGDNAAAWLGRHFGPWVPTGLREQLRTRSLFQQAVDRRFSVMFANAYPRAHHAAHRQDARRPGAFPYAAAAAGRLERDEEDVRSGNALASSITTERWRQHLDPGAPVISPQQAGSRLASLATAADLTIFAHYDTDYVGHRGGLGEGITAIEKVDAFLGGLLDGMDERTLLLVCSDHGNLEDAEVGHTRNPTLFIAAGAGHEIAAARVQSITDVAPLVLELLETRPAEAAAG